MIQKYILIKHSSIPYQYYYHIYRNKRPGRLIFRSNKQISKIHQKPSVLRTPPPLKNHPSKLIGFMYSNLLKNHPSKPFSFTYSPLWEITVFGGQLFWVGVYFGKYGKFPKKVRCDVHLEQNCIEKRTYLMKYPKIAKFLPYACTKKTVEFRSKISPTPLLVRYKYHPYKVNRQSE